MARVILHLNNFYFELPQDFNGTLPEAIRLLAKYMEEAPNLNLPMKTRPSQNAWLSFLETIEDGGKFSGNAGIDAMVSGNLSPTDGSSVQWEKREIRFK